MMATQLMQVKLVNGRGETMLLPETLALDGWPSERELPGVEIQGKSGRVVDLSLAGTRPRTVRVVGSISGVDKDDSDRIREQIAGFVMRANPLRLYRYQGADRYMLCNAKAIDHAYITGRFGGRIFNLSITFEAADPFLYGELIQATKTVTASPTSWQVNQPGSVERQQPIVYIKAVGQLVKPQLLSDEGVVMALDDTIPVGKALVTNSDTHEAYVTDGDLAYYLHKWGVSLEPGKAPTSEISVVGKMGSAWMLYGWPLIPGSNALRYSDDQLSSHKAEITLAWSPRYH